MSAQKQVVEQYLEGFRRGDHALVLGCLTEDVVWDMPGFFHWEGRAAFDQEIENEAFVGRPVIGVSRMVEEEDVVVAEGTVRARKRDGGELNAVFCDVFTFREGRIGRLVSYLMEVR